MTQLTPAQQEVWNLRQQGFSQKAIAKQLGKSRRTVRDLIARAENALDRDPAIQLAMDELGTSHEPDTLWIKTKDYSMQLRPKKSEVSFMDQLVEALRDVETAKIIDPPTHELSDEMVVYPLFDVHHGLLAHAEISGEDTNLDLSKERLLTGLGRIMGGAPNAYRAVIINGGDFTHQTDDMNRTRRSGHVLDVAGRNIVTVLEAIEIISSAIEMALTKHQVVEYFSVPGNHDPQNWEMILIGIKERYRDNPRVTIDTTWNEFSVLEHGEVAIFVHHGDKRTPKDLAMFCAAEFPEVWGRTRYRMLLTGHLHHQKLEEFPGVIWMQLPAVTVRDAHAAGGYKSHSMLMALTFDRESEVARNTLRLK